MSKGDIESNIFFKEIIVSSKDSITRYYDGDIVDNEVHDLDRMINETTEQSLGLRQDNKKLIFEKDKLSSDFAEREIKLLSEAQEQKLKLNALKVSNTKAIGRISSLTNRIDEIAIERDRSSRTLLIVIMLAIVFLTVSMIW